MNASIFFYFLFFKNVLVFLLLVKESHPQLHSLQICQVKTSKRGKLMEICIFVIVHYTTHEFKFVDYFNTY